MNRRGRSVLAVTLILGAASKGLAVDLKLRASLRNYDFLRLESRAGDAASRRDTEFLSFRLMPEIALGGGLRIEAHLVADAISPAGSPAVALASGRARTYLPLDPDPGRMGSVEISGYFDRLAMRFHAPGADLAVGRQAITWGVNTFWPALDLFAPFAPTRVDRDYKPGVDAVRLTVPFGSRSEIQAVGAVLGDDLRRDGSAAVLVRFGAGSADIGLMGGSFHGDTVAGAFAAMNIAGTVLRGEASWTRSGIEADRARHPSFWRGGVGLERQLSSTVNAALEVAANDYGEAGVRGYPAVVASDRFRRGELGGLGRWHAGATVSWQFHPLGMLTNAALVNIDDGSTAWLPRLAWSLTDDAEIFVGALIAIGRGPDPYSFPRSEYGSTASRLLAGFKTYL
jgi:hypothetical protein